MDESKWANKKMVILFTFFLLSCRSDYCVLDFTSVEIAQFIDEASEIRNLILKHEFKGTFAKEGDEIKLYWHEGVLPEDILKVILPEKFIVVTHYPNYTYFALESGWKGESCGLLALKEDATLPLQAEVIRKLESKNKTTWYFVSKN